MIPKHVIDTIMDTARIEEVVADFVSLKKAGADYRALSPFSNEKTPSFYVVPNKQIFKDFSSGKGGNVVTFLMEHEQMSYPEALRFLAKRYNIDIPEEREMTQEEMQAVSEKESLFIVLQHALEYYREQLLESEDGKAIGLTYFQERGFREDTIEKFGLGFAPNAWGAFTEEALAKGYKLDYLNKAGLTKINDAGKQYDMFRNRVIFPIHNMVGKVVAFAARQLSKEDKGPKYLNSPESPVYHKSDVLYGMYFAKNKVRVDDKCFLVEGYTDVITLHQAGIENVVASSGTSLTEGQIRQVKRFTPNITVLYDGDPAGLKASQRGIDLILAQGMNVRLVIFPDGEDPDSYCRKVGGEEFTAYIAEHEQDFILFKSQLLMGESGHDPLKKAEAVKSMVASIAIIPDPLTRTVFAQECARIMEVPEEVIVAELNKERRKAQPRQETAPPPMDEPDLAALFLPDDAFEAPVKKAVTADQEKRLMLLLVRYAAEPYNEQQSVAEFMVEQLSEGLDFEHPTYLRILNEVKQKLQEEPSAEEEPKPEADDAFLLEDQDSTTEETPGEPSAKTGLSSRYFSQHPDAEINSFAAEALIDRYKVSDDWSGLHEIPIVNEEQNYRQDIFSALLYFKIRKVEVLIEENQNALKDAAEEQIDELMAKQVQLLEFRKALTQISGTTIIK
ncbi:MAG: DNA primase [Bacteroidetes bacterium]|nr:MAG: DNA primase [Bacteroidota bacterium]